MSMKHTQHEIYAATALSALGNLRRFMPLLFDHGRMIRLAAFVHSLRRWPFPSRVPPDQGRGAGVFK